jgi:hypothetical protein
LFLIEEEHVLRVRDLGAAQVERWVDRRGYAARQFAVEFQRFYRVYCDGVAAKGKVLMIM